MNILRVGARQLRICEASTTSRPLCHSNFAIRRIVKPTQRGFARRNTNQDDDQFDVNYFEDELVGRSRKRRRVTQHEVDEDIEEDEEFDDQLGELEKDTGSLNILKQLNEDDEGGEEDEDYKDIFSQEQIDAFRQSAEEKDEDELPSFQILPQHPIPKQSQRYLDKLNEILDSASFEGTEEEKIRQDIWRWYSRSKDNVPGLLGMIPKDAWDLIWQSQSKDAPSNPDRMIHLKTLASDKESAKWDLTNEERLIKIEGTFVEGQREAALALFEDQLREQENRTAALYQLGVRMYSLIGDTDRAEQLLNRLFELNNAADPRVMSSLISAYAHKQDERSLLRAWTLFQDLQRRLSSDIQMSDYDAVALSFLGAGQKDFALATFRDMMLHGEKEQSPTAEAFSRLSDFVGLTRSPRESTALSLDAIKYLPRKYQNKYFYASWLRKLLSENNFNAAAQVMELMYERGVKPDAKHANGLLSAWLRDPRKATQKRAEELGWTMVQRRLDFVRERGRTSSMDHSNVLALKSAAESREGVQVPVNISRPVPSATIETFCILLQFYLRRNRYGHVRHLRNLLAPAELMMNSFFMNHLLYAELRTQGSRSVWDRFAALAENVRPDMETWACLWESEKQHVNDNDSLDFSGFPVPQELLRRMLSWLNTLHGQEKSNAYSDFDEHHYHDIVRSFCYARDPAGCFVAMHVMHHHFGITPSEPLLRTLLMMMTKLLPPNVANRERRVFPHRFARRRRKGPAAQEDFERDMAFATFLLDSTWSTRKSALEEQGVLFDDLGPDLKALETHKVCLGILLRVMQEREKKESDDNDDRAINRANDVINLAANRIGVGDLNVGQILESRLPDQ